MGKIVGGFIVPHNPLIFNNPKGARTDESDRVMDAYAEVGRRIGDLDATSVVIIGCDHYLLFGPGLLPSIHIAIGEIDGPLEKLRGMERGPIPHNTKLAEHLMNTGFANGFDWSVSKTMTLDHSTAIPYHMCIRQNPNLAVVPIYLACGASPYLRLQRARELGEMLNAAITSSDNDERVVIIGSGGISHWVGEAQMGSVNPEFDKEILDYVARGDLDGITALSDDYIIESGGNGAMEIRTFVCAMAAAGKGGAEVIAYEPVKGWITGLGFAELQYA